MEFVKPYLADGKDFNSRMSRQEPLKSARFDTKSDTKIGPGADSGGSSPLLFSGGRVESRNIRKSASPALVLATPP